MNTQILLITPPFTQLNTPYPSTSYLLGYLKEISINGGQLDLGLELLLKIFSQQGLTQIFDFVESTNIELSYNSKRIMFLRKRYESCIDDVIMFLQGKNEMLAHTICETTFLPQASRFEHTDDLDWSFGNMGIRDKARHLATLFLEDISDFIVENVDEHFGFSRYAERLSSSAFTFDNIYNELTQENSLIIHFQEQILSKAIQKHKPGIIGLSVPFPGNLFAALKCGQYIKLHYPDIKIVLGGGYPNTELRSIKDKRIFEFIDFITLDDGEIPLHQIIKYINKECSLDSLLRTFTLKDDELVYLNSSTNKDLRFRNTPTPDYSGLFPDRYLSVIEMTNPMHRLWSDGFWNKLTMAHGCYWKRCTFCDTTLDYIARFEPGTAHALCDKMETLMKQTGCSGFHFVDEAAPPALMISLAKEIIRRELNVTWWTNIRFEQSFTSDACRLLKRSGCIAVSGGLEVASDRILSLINKGVSVSKVAQVCDNLTQAGIMTHAYLMYGFPTQTEQETIDALEVVRQLFEEKVILSGFWHQFALTAHSPVGKNPDKFGIQITCSTNNPFANNDLTHIDQDGALHSQFSEGLKKSIYNYMHDVGIDFPLQDWFEFRIPKTTIPKTYIQKCLSKEHESLESPSSKIIWPESLPEIKYYTKRKKGKSTSMAELTFHILSHSESLQIKEKSGKWIFEILKQCHISNTEDFTFSQLEESYNQHDLGDFPIFMHSFTFQKLKELGLLII